MKTSSNCPECGGDEIYAQAVSAIGMYGPDLLPKLVPAGFDNFLKQELPHPCRAYQQAAPEAFVGSRRLPGSATGWLYAVSLPFSRGYI